MLRDRGVYESTELEMPKNVSAKHLISVITVIAAGVNFCSENNSVSDAALPDSALAYASSLKWS